MPRRRFASLAVSVALLASLIISVFAMSGPAALAGAFSQLVGSSVALVSICLIAGVLLSSLRLKFITADLGYSLSLRDATVTLSIGQLAGTLFFQFAGQLMGRTAILASRGIPPSASVIISGYERVFALCVSLALAACGAIYLFGTLSFDMQAGGLTLIKLGLGLFAVTAAGAAFAWGPRAVLILRQLTPALMLRFARSAAISLAIQLSTLAAYIIAGRALAPHVDFFALAAASSVIMFAASLPISFGGWGMREMSSVMALQAVGLPTASALLLGLLIGVLSLAVVAAMAAALLLIASKDPAPRAASAVAAAPDYTTLLDWMLPIAAASAVFFQVFVPAGAGKFNVNLADPVALIGAALFFLRHLRQGFPVWRIPHLNAIAVAMTAVIALSFLHGYVSFGFTDWAFASRTLGWPMLLCYAVTGALIVRRAQDEGLQILLATFAAAGAALAAFDIGLSLLARLGFEQVASLVTYRLTGFSQNSNAFAFILIMAMIATLLLRGRDRARLVLLSTIMTGIWFTGSRAGIGTACAVLVMGWWWGLRAKPTLAALAMAMTGIAAIGMTPWLAGMDRANMISMVDSASSNAEHFRTMLGGLQMFLSHPLFGAGLGAYMQQQMQATGIPLVIHSTPIWLLAEMGLAGFTVFAAATCAIVRYEIRRTGETAALLVLLLFSGIGLMSQLHELLYQRSFWLLLGAALAMPAGLGLSRDTRC